MTFVYTHAYSHYTADALSHQPVLPDPVGLVDALLLTIGAYICVGDPTLLCLGVISAYAFS